MKKLILTLCAVALGSLAYAGTESYSGKEMKQMETPCPTWYGDSEFNLGISGAVGISTDTGDNLLGDVGWGGAIDLKYFFHKYFGIGLQGFGMATDTDDDNNFFGFDDDDNDFAGGALATFTFRYPIPCSRWAPYGWAGAGAVWGGHDDFFVNGAGVVVRRDDDDARFIAQAGIGIEYRFTRKIGWTNDVSYNLVEHNRDDFIMIRTGINFAF